MDEDDPVVQEIPVFLSQALAKHLYIYQYPVKPGNRDWNDVTITNAAVKHKNQLVRLEVNLDTYSDKYSDSKGEQIALNTDGLQESSRYSKDKEKSEYFKSGYMDKIVYESSNPCLDNSRYAVAILQDKELHCTPVQGIVQLRPSHSYFDKQDKRKKELDKEEHSDEEDEEPEAQQVTVKFSRLETDVAKKAREKSFEFISKKVTEEPWYKAEWYHSNTDHAELERLKLYTDSHASVGWSCEGAQYARSLAPSGEDDEPTLDFKDRLHQALVDAKLLSFSSIVSLARSSGAVAPGTGALSAEDEARVLAALGARACCVRGAWTARSADVAPPGAVPAAARAAARDHLLYLFTQYPYVDRRKVDAAVKLPPDVVLDIMKSIAKYNPNTGWELLLPPDTAFEAKHPDIVQRYKMYFEGRQRLFNEMMLGENIPKRQRKKSQRDSVSSDTLMSPKSRCNSVSEDESGAAKRPKNKSNTGLGKRTRHVSSSSAQEMAT